MSHSSKGSVRARLIALVASAMLLLSLAAGPASAQQAGLVNVNVSGVDVQLPIAVAANICDTNVNILAVQLRHGGATCDATAESEAVFPNDENGNSTAPPAQAGLVNVNISDVTIQVPLAVAANLCDTNINALALQFRTGGATCDATAGSSAS